MQLSLAPPSDRRILFASREALKWWLYIENVAITFVRAGVKFSTNQYAQVWKSSLKHTISKTSVMTEHKQCNAWHFRKRIQTPSHIAFPECLVLLRSIRPTVVFYNVTNCTHWRRLVNLIRFGACDCIWACTWLALPSPGRPDKVSTLQSLVGNHCVADRRDETFELLVRSWWRSYLTLQWPVPFCALCLSAEV